MKITREMRLNRAIEYLRKEREQEMAAADELEGIQIREIIIMRNKKRMYIADLDQMIRNAEAEISEMRLAESISGRECAR